MGVIEDSKQKTAFIKSFPPLKYFLEKGRIEIRTRFFSRKSEFHDTVNSFKSDLLRYLTEEEIIKLAKLRIPVEQNGLILLLPYLNYPLVGYNLDKVHALFKNPGWLFHAITDTGLISSCNSGFLLSPVEMIFDKKQYLSSKFEDDPNVER